MSDLVERLRERGHTIMPPSVQEAIAIARKRERELRFIAQVSTRDLVGIVLADRIEELEASVRELRGALAELRWRLHAAGRRPEECYEMSLIDAALTSNVVVQPPPKAVGCNVVLGATNNGETI